MAWHWLEVGPILGKSRVKKKLNMKHRKCCEFMLTEATEEAKNKIAKEVIDTLESN